MFKQSEASNCKNSVILWHFCMGNTSYSRSCIAASAPHLHKPSAAQHCLQPCTHCQCFATCQEEMSRMMPFCQSIRLTGNFQPKRLVEDVKARWDQKLGRLQICSNLMDFVSAVSVDASNSGLPGDTRTQAKAVAPQQPLHECVTL